MAIRNAWSTHCNGISSVHGTDIPNAQESGVGVGSRGVETGTQLVSAAPHSRNERVGLNVADSPGRSPSRRDRRAGPRRVAVDRGPLQGRYATGDGRLVGIVRERALIISQGLTAIARLLANLSQGRQRPGIVRLDGQGVQEVILGSVAIAQFLLEGASSIFGSAKARLMVRPAFDEVECLFRASLFDQ